MGVDSTQAPWLARQPQSLAQQELWRQQLFLACGAAAIAAAGATAAAGTIAPAGPDFEAAGPAMGLKKNPFPLAVNST